MQRLPALVLSRPYFRPGGEGAAARANVLWRQHGWAAGPAVGPAVPAEAALSRALDGYRPLAPEGYVSAAGRVEQLLRLGAIRVVRSDALIALAGQRGGVICARCRGNSLRRPVAPTIKRKDHKFRALARWGRL